MTRVLRKRKIDGALLHRDKFISRYPERTGIANTVANMFHDDPNHAEDSNALVCSYDASND